MDVREPNVYTFTLTVSERMHSHSEYFPGAKTASG